MQSDCDPPLNFENTKDDGDDTIIIVIVVCVSNIIEVIKDFIRNI